MRCAAPAARAGVVLGTVCLMAGLAGCTPGGHGHQAGPSVPVTEHVAPSLFMAAVSGPALSANATGQLLSGVVAASARPDENVEILRAETRPAVLVTAGSPPPATVTIPGKPAAPGAGATTYQQATYQNQLKRWEGEATAARRTVAIRTGTAVSAWAHGLDIARRVSQSTPAGTGPGSLASDCTAADSALVGLQQMDEDMFGSRRVIMLFADNLADVPNACDLNGDDVIVVTTFLSSKAAATGAQADLLSAGAAGAAVLGPEATPAGLAQLISAGLNQAASTETLSGPALFANNSSVLLPGAAREITPLLAPLRRPGAVAVINGYASTPGSATTNYLLSYARAAAVAAFLEAHGIPASSLVVIGHGASDLVAPGPSGANRRVTVVIEQPLSNDS
jgi:outer membrane protein OmpA-like peptidoglycan-associated protein